MGCGTSSDSGNTAIESPATVENHTDIAMKGQRVGSSANTKPGISLESRLLFSSDKRNVTRSLSATRRGNLRTGRPLSGTSFSHSRILDLLLGISNPIEWFGHHSNAIAHDRGDGQHRGSVHHQARPGGDSGKGQTQYQQGSSSMSALLLKSSLAVVCRNKRDYFEFDWSSRRSWMSPLISNVLRNTRNSWPASAETSWATLESIWNRKC